MVDYLLARGLLQTKWVVDGSLVVRNLSGRNRNLALVGGGDAPSYFLKQGIGADGAATVLHEAGVYTLFSVPECPLAQYLPRFLGYDEDRGILILELVHGARDLRTHHLSTGRFSTALASGIGDALGALHNHSAAQVELIHPGATPWILSIHRPGLGVFSDATGATLDMIKIIQSMPDIGSHLDDLRSSWQSSVLIHQDLKWQNFLACKREGSNGRTVKIIDWEALCPGDPCWDIGSVFANYLSFWLESIEITGHSHPEHFAQMARYPVHRMQPALRAYWRAYTSRRRLDDPSAACLLLRAASFTGAGLLASAYGAAQMLPKLDGNLILHLQLAMNILARPGDAGHHLLGIAAGGE